MTDPTTIEANARALVAVHLAVEPEKVTREADFIEHLGADSLDTVELIMQFEDQFEIELSDDEAEAIKTFGDAVDLITRKVAA